MLSVGAADTPAFLVNLSKDGVRILITDPKSILDELTASLLPSAN